MDRIGRYEIVGHLATGGMGQVYLARSTGLGGFERKVVVKTLDAPPQDDGSLVRMFLDEARLLGALHHQYIAPVYEVGRDGEDRYFLVMDYVRGETAEAAFKRARSAATPLRMGFALTIVSAVAAALEYAHALRAHDGSPLEIVHRDVSLSNIMIGVDGAVKLIDFGIAKFSKRTTQTQVGSLKGKLAYMSPEQVLRRPVDRRADIFALGIVLYELTTLEHAFDGESELVMLEKITAGEVKLPSQIVQHYPRELERIVMKALAVDPDMRYADAGEMGREIEAFAASRSIATGHAAVIEGMQALFDSTPPGGRRRLARASLYITGRHTPQPGDSVAVVQGELDDTTTRPQLADDIDEAPTSPIELVTPSIPTVALKPAALDLPLRPATIPNATPPPPMHALPTVSPVLAVPAAAPVAPPPPAPAVAVRFAARRQTSTDKVLPYGTQLPIAPRSRWWLLVFVLAIVAGAAAAIVATW